MTYEENNLKLIYVLKIGYNTKNEGNYEFIFSSNPENILVDDWCWDMSPACDHALPPTEEYIDAIISLRTKSFDLVCLHEAVDRPYMHGYHTIHALAYENMDVESGEGNDYEKYFESQDDDTPLLVFHYGMTLAKVKDMLNARNITLKNNEFIEISSIKF